MRPLEKGAVLGVRCNTVECVSVFLFVGGLCEIYCDLATAGTSVWVQVIHCKMSRWGVLSKSGGTRLNTRPGSGSHVSITWQHQWLVTSEYVLWHNEVGNGGWVRGVESCICWEYTATSPDFGFTYILSSFFIYMNSEVVNWIVGFASLKMSDKYF